MNRQEMNKDWIAVDNNRWMIIASIRYCLGRMAYVVSECCDWLIDNWESIPYDTRNIIIRDIEEQFDRDDQARKYGTGHYPLGMDCDRKSWERVRKLWTSE